MINKTGGIADNHTVETGSYALTLFPLLLGAFLPPLDYFIVNLGLTAIQRSLEVSDTQLQWVISAYACTYAAGLITGGKLGDRYGRKRLFLLGMAGFVFASLICSMATQGNMLIAGRILQGAFASILAPQVLATIRTVFPAHHQTCITALYGFIFGIAAIAGQMGGGIIVDLNLLDLGWRILFLINLPIGGIALLLAALRVPENRADKQTTFDIPGLLLLTCLLILFIYPLARGSQEGWPLWSILALIACIPVALVFIRLEHNTLAAGKEPLVNLNIFRLPVVTLGLLLSFVFYSDSVFFLSFGLYLQAGLGLSAFKSGMLILPFTLGFIIGPLLTPAIVRRYGEHVVPLGFAAMIAGFGGMAALLTDTGSPGLPLYLTLLIGGVGHGIVLSSLTRIVMFFSPRIYAGLMSGLQISLLQIGSAVGIAALGGLFFYLLGSDLSAASYTFAFRVALVALTVLLTGCLLLSLWLARLTARATAA